MPPAGPVTIRLPLLDVGVPRAVNAALPLAVGVAEPVADAREPDLLRRAETLRPSGNCLSSAKPEMSHRRRGSARQSPARKARTGPPAPRTARRLGTTTPGYC